MSMSFASSDGNVSLAPMNLSQEEVAIYGEPCATSRAEGRGRTDHPGSVINEQPVKPPLMWCDFSHVLFERKFYICAVMKQC